MNLIRGAAAVGAVPYAVVLQKGFDQCAQGAQLADQLLRFDRHFVPVRPQNASDDNVHRLQKHIVDAERAKVGRVKLQEM